MTKIHAACIQVNQGACYDQGFESLKDLITQAAAKGARLIVTPECSDSMIWPTTEKAKSAFTQEDHPTLQKLQALAAELSVQIVVGSLAVRDDEIGKLRNRCFVIDQNGKILSQYDKIHLFDAELGAGENYCESLHYHPGNTAQIAKMDWGVLGLSICYDVRFAHLFRHLAQEGAQVLSVPAAFAVPTGQAHWDVLLRARAIETGSYVLAAGQTGKHPGDRKTYGHSMIIGPWGDVIAQMGDEVGFIDAIIDMDEVARCRKNLPSLTHDRGFVMGAGV